MRKKRSNKKEEKIEEVKEEVIKTQVGEVLKLVADENNPVSDGLEYKEGEKDE